MPNTPSNDTSAASSWWKDTPIYHIYPRSFHDTNEDGIGDLPGIIEKLPYLAELGIGAIWMGPVFRSPQVDNGYDISDYRDIDPIFGTLADMDRLIATAHRLGIRVLLDLVFNHSSNRHWWFVESERDPSGPYGDYYIWRDAQAAPLPNNWRSFFTGPTWTWSEVRGQYYLHLFAPEQPDLNWDNPAVREELADIANFWLDRGVDGFRLDVINFIAKVEGLPSVEEVAEHRDAGEAVSSGGREGSTEKPDRLSRSGPAAYIDHARMVGYLREFRRRLHRREEIVLVGETPHLSYEWARELTASENGALDMVLLFDHLEVDHGSRGRWDPVPWTTERLARVFREQQTALAGSSWPSLYMGNHDQPRIVSRYGDDGEFRCASATALATLFYLQRGTPIIYQGDEIGMANYPLEDATQIVDIESGNAYRALVETEGVEPAEALRRVARNARDNGRTPMQWDGTPHPSWWYPLNPDHREWNVAAQEQLPEHQSVLAHYRRLLALRAEYEALRRGSFQLVTGDTPCIAFRRRASTETITVVVNLSSQETAVPPAIIKSLAKDRTVQIVLSTAYNRGGHAPDNLGSATITASLAPWEARVLLQKDPALTRIA
ncbi:MAG: glycoside hydrolase family 13 protein [Alkalispirochaeta sp.]